MSLINDALQRAKQQTAQPTPPSHLQLRPMEPTQPERKRSGITVSIVATILIITVALVSGWFQRNRTAMRQAQAVAANSVPQPTMAVAPTPVPAPVKAVEPSPAAEASTLADKAEGLKPPAAPVETVPKAPAIKLQAILFNNARPSAIINGKTVYVGNHFGEFQVAAITQTSATLISARQTNILSFEE